MKLIKICPECGLEFETTNGNQKFCKRKHYRNCVICNTEFEITPYHLTAKDARVTCSRKCTIILRKQTNLQKYGGVAPAAAKEVRDKMEATNLERYGVRHATQSQAIIDKMKSTNLAKYGQNWYMQTEEWVDKVRATSEQLYGTSWPTQSEIVQQNTINTNLSRYGTQNPMQSSIVTNKFIQSHMIDGDKLHDFLSFKEDVAKFITNLALDHKPTIYELSRITGVNESTVGSYIHLQHCEDLVKFHVSAMEQSVADYIRSIVDTPIRMNVHDIITPYEIDIYLPEYKIGIECNPTATHNTNINVFDDGPSTIYPSYHLMKTRQCEDKQVFLFHIFGYEWTHSRPIIQSILSNMLGKSARRIYARNCTISVIDGKQCSEFLRQNHRQGNANSPIRLGLFIADELVAVMTFGKLRHTIGDVVDDCYELVRFCSALNTSVIGGASKLFQYFRREYNPMRIRSFSDRAHTTGALYSKLGFYKVHESDPGYTWVNLQTDKSYNRVNAQKHNIKKFLNDNNIDLDKTEAQIMVEHGFVQVFDCGTILWEWCAD